MLPLWDGTVFDYAVSSFLSEFSEAPFLFIYRETGGVRGFLDERTRALGLKDPRFAELVAETAGQAETVEFGLDCLALREDESLTIFNIDTFRMPTIGTTGVPPNMVGWLEVFRGTGENWSFVQPREGEQLAVRTTEKDPISDLCCTGLYHFASIEVFRDALALERINPSTSELYVAPIYNHLIMRGDRIGYGVVKSEDVVFCGIPLEYEELRNRSGPYQLPNSLDSADA
jgi:hypothetical protein